MKVRLDDKVIVCFLSDRDGTPMEYIAYPDGTDRSAFVNRHLPHGVIDDIVIVAQGAYDSATAGNLKESDKYLGNLVMLSEKCDLRGVISSVHYLAGVAINTYMEQHADKDHKADMKRVHDFEAKYLVTKK